ncbi:MAG: type II toxin-antitoxin system VapC family toxin [Bythopirellula sp.]|nr:type II toxin-antitoxin system VapC family toxin [Bythopirellula sp.]
MAGKFLLDTNIVIAHLDQEKLVNEFINGIPEVFLPVIVVGEMYYGAIKSGRAASNISRLENFILKVTILFCDTSTARVYGQIKNELRLLGKPIPDNDLWIAATARQHGLTLASRDGHFSAVPNLQVENW